MDARKPLAELVGTFVFFLIGLLSILSTKAFPGGPDLLVGPVIGAVAGWAVYRALLDEPARA